MGDCWIRGLGRIGIFTMHGGWRLAGAREVSGEEAIYMGSAGENVSFCRFFCVRFVLSYIITQIYFVGR
jgi:hypothetical protein